MTTFNTGAYPPGCTQRDVDMAQPGYWDWDDDRYDEPSEEELLAEEAEHRFWDLMIDMMEGQRTPGWAWREPIVSFYCPVTDVHFVSVVVTPPILF